MAEDLDERSESNVPGENSLISKPVASVLVTWPQYPADEPWAGGLLSSAGFQLKLAPKLGNRTPGEVANLAGDVVGAIVSTDPFDEAVFDAAPNLRVIARVGVGTDSIDLDAAHERGIVITTTPGANEEIVADHVMSMILGTIRRSLENDASVRSGDWNRAQDLTPYDLGGATIGLVGLGTIGRHVANRLGGFPVHLLGYDPAVKECPGVECVENLSVLLRRSDIISLHVPMQKDTFHLIGADEFAHVRPGAIIVNASRGGLIDEDALIEGLNNGTVRAAALDVFENEPPAGSRLLEFPNVLLSPHIGGLSANSITSMLKLATRSVVDVLEGRRPVNALSDDSSLNGMSK
jgi:phosphoglycerate dehydrogenase-like enzyme